MIRTETSGVSTGSARTVVHRGRRRYLQAVEQGVPLTMPSYRTYRLGPVYGICYA